MKKVRPNPFDSELVLQIIFHRQYVTKVNSLMKDIKTNRFLNS